MIRCTANTAQESFVAQLMTLRRSIEMRYDEDVFGEVCRRSVAAFERRDWTRDQTGFFWTLASQSYIDQRRKTSRRPVFEQTSCDPADRRPTPLEELIQMEDSGQLQDELANLPEPYGSTLVRHYLQDTPIREIAAEDGVSSSCVSTRLDRARQQMRENLGLAASPAAPAKRPHRK